MPLDVLAMELAMLPAWRAALLLNQQLLADALSASGAARRSVLAKALTSNWESKQLPLSSVFYQACMLDARCSALLQRVAPRLRKEGEA